MLGAFKWLKITYASFFGSGLGMILITFFWNLTEWSLDLATDSLFLYAVPFVAISLVTIERLVYQSFKSEGRELVSVSRKWQLFQFGLVVSWISIDLSILFGVIAAMVSSQFIFLAATLIFLIRFLSRYPKAEKLILDFNLKTKELEALFHNHKNIKKDE